MTRTLEDQGFIKHDGEVMHPSLDFKGDATSRQRCRFCGRPVKFNFHVPDAVWHMVVPDVFEGAALCLFCFDAFAEARGIEYASSLDELWFAGDKAVFEFLVVRRIPL